jgi:hypothetical protein
MPLLDSELELDEMASRWNINLSKVEQREIVYTFIMLLAVTAETDDSLACVLSTLSGACRHVREHGIGYYESLGDLAQAEPFGRLV